MNDITLFITFYLIPAFLILVAILRFYFPLKFPNSYVKKNTDNTNHFIKVQKLQAKLDLVLGVSLLIGTFVLFISLIVYIHAEALLIIMLFAQVLISVFVTHKNNERILRTLRKY